MAIWQVDLTVVRKASPFSGIDYDIVQRIVAALPELPPWTEGMRWWGVEDEDRVDCFFGESGSFELSVRVYARRINTEFLELVLALCRDLHAELVDDCGTVAAMSVGELEKYVRAASEGLLPPGLMSEE